MAALDPTGHPVGALASAETRVDWGAIFAGAVIAAGLSVIFTTFAGALGLGSVSFDDGEISYLGLVITGLFVAVSTVAVYMLGGYVTGRLRRRDPGATADETSTRDGLHGLVVWGLGAIVSSALAISAVTGAARTAGSAVSTAVEATGSAAGGIAQGAGQLAGGALSGVGQAAGGLAQGVGGAANSSVDQMLPQDLKSNPIDYLVDSLMRPEGSATNGQPQDPASVERRLGGILVNVVRTGEISDADRNDLRSAVAARTGLTPEQVDARVNEGVEKAQAIRAEAQKKLDAAKAEAERLRAEAEKRVEEAKTAAADAAEQARIAGILTAFLIAASALVAGAAASIGAIRGGRHRDEGTVWAGLSYRR